MLIQGDGPARSFLEIQAGDPASPVLVLCDHAGNRVPPELKGLGLLERDLERHIAYDIGAAMVARGLAKRLGAQAILNHCSRLVIDPNRRPRTPTSIPAVSDGVEVPANLQVGEAELRRRVRRYHLPYHRAIARAIAALRRSGRIPVILAVHSFTPRLRHGQPRPWQVGILWRNDERLAAPILAALQARGDLTAAGNVPYSGLEEFGYTIELHAQRTRLPHVMVEIRQDEIGTPAGAGAYAQALAEAALPVLRDGPPLGLWSGPLVEGQPWRRPRGLMRPG